MKPVALTAHAEKVARERGIERDWIERGVRNPLWRESDRAGDERWFLPIPERGRRILRIVCTETDTEVRVITAFFDRNARSPA
jgi:hypothetical protein